MAEKGKPKSSGEPSVQLITPARVAVPEKSAAAGKLKLSISKLKYPIANQASLIKSMKGLSQIHASFFPIKSAEDFEAKLSQFYNVFSGSALSHPTAVAPPTKTRGK